VQSAPGQSTDVLVQGAPNKQQIAGAAGGVKLMSVRRLADKGHRVTIIGERQFWRLAEGKSAARAPTKRTASAARKRSARRAVS
jgi:hypothetical protein